MKKTSKRCAALLSAILLVSSCNSSAPTVVDNPVEEQPVTMECYAEAYASLVSNLKISLQSDADEISTFEDIERIFDSVYTTLPQRDKYRIEHFEFSGSAALRSEDLSTSAEVDDLYQVLEDALLMITPYLFTERPEELLEVIESYKEQTCYTSLTEKERSVVDEALLMLDTIRPLVLSKLSSDDHKVQTRMSPGDRMIWSESAKSMSDCQRKAASVITAESALLALAFSRGNPFGIMHASKRIAEATNDYLTCHD